MSKLNPPPQIVPHGIDKSLSGFVQNLVRSVYQIFDAVGGGSGIPKIFNVTGTPSSYDADTPDGYIKINLNGEEKLIPYWDA
ncbi:MAG: hypothetical protein HRT94_05765 [Alphaproteobacteria bacterium]|nr:hypothetical protein [Alphaproteobacteria bacterium]